MSQLELKRVSKDIIDRAEASVVPERGLPKVVDDYFIERLKRDELEHAEVNAKLYEGLRSMVKAEVLPLYEQYLSETARIRERRQNRKLWQYVLGTVAVVEILEAVLTRGRSFAPQVLVPTAIFDCLLGFILYTAAQYFDDLQMRRARRRLEQSLDGLDGKLQTDIDYDQRRELLHGDVLHAEALEILAHYERPEDFWRDYCRSEKRTRPCPRRCRR